MIIDSHSHFGLDIFHGETNIDDYIDFAKKTGIDVGIIMSVPSPCRDLKNPYSRYMYWKYDNGKMNYFGTENPFLKVNYDIYNLLKIKTNNDFKLLFVPMIHPVLDDISSIEKLIKDTDPVAIKIHGVGSGVGPNDINNDLIDLLKQSELPLIVHTDCDRGKGSISMNYIRNINNGLNWANFFINNKIKGILNHGSNLDPEVFKLVNKSDYLKVALGPDRIVCIDNNRLYIDCFQNYKNYLMILKQNLDNSKIIYDTDYNWNKLSEEDTDYDSINRIHEVFDKEEYCDNILGKNLLEFNPKILRKIKEN